MCVTNVDLKVLMVTSLRNCTKVEYVSVVCIHLRDVSMFCVCGLSHPAEPELAVRTFAESAVERRFFDCTCVMTTDHGAAVPDGQ